jgi:hypothetical protein
MITADIHNYDGRIKAGKQKEAIIIKTLRDKGVNVLDPTAHEDMHDKIDGWIVDEDGTKHALQIKFRESGDDILVEIVKDWDKQIPGRDMIGLAEYYLVVNRHGDGKLFPTKSIKTLAQKVLDFVKQALPMNNTRTDWEFKGKWQAKLTIDRALGNRKLMGYFNPSIFPCIGEWKFAL